MVQTIFFLDVFGWGKRQLYAVCLKAFRAYCSLKYHLYLEKSIAFRYSFEKPVMSQNIASKLAAKRRKLKVLKSWSEALMNSPESTKFFACVQIEIVNNFLCVKVSLCIKNMHWNTPPCRVLQQTAIQHFETIPQSNRCPASGQLYFFLTLGLPAFKSLTSFIKNYINLKEYWKYQMKTADVFSSYFWVG